MQLSKGGAIAVVFGCAQMERALSSGSFYSFWLLLLSSDFYLLALIPSMVDFLVCLEGWCSLLVGDILAFIGDIGFSLFAAFYLLAEALVAVTRKLQTMSYHCDSCKLHLLASRLAAVSIGFTLSCNKAIES